MIYAVLCDDLEVVWDTNRAIAAAIYRNELNGQMFELDMVSDGDQVILDNAVKMAVLARVAKPTFDKVAPIDYKGVEDVADTGIQTA